MSLNFPAGPTNGQEYTESGTTFFWDAAAGIWRRKIIVTNLNNLNDVIITSPTTSQILEYNGTQWVNGQIDTAGITDNAVNYAKLQDVAALSVVGRSANSLGDAGNISAGTDGHVLRRSGTSLGFGTIARAGLSNGLAAFTARAVITSTPAGGIWTVPALGSTIVKVTVIGGGGGGGGLTTIGGNGTATTFNVGGAGSVTAAGGLGGHSGQDNSAKPTSTLGFSASNGGSGSITRNGSGDRRTSGFGTGGKINIAYFNLSGISSASVTVGSGGAGGTGGSPGNPGGGGEIIIEYVAA